MALYLLALGDQGYVRTRAVDGFSSAPHLLLSSLAGMVDKAVPELQDRGVYRTVYEGTTLRGEHGLLSSALRTAALAGT